MYPPDAVRLFEQLPSQWVDIETLDDFIDISITEVYDPTKFWFILENENCSCKLRDLMKNLE